MGYVIANGGGNSSGRYYLTDTCNKPRIAVKVNNSTSYLPMQIVNMVTTINTTKTIADTWALCNCESTYKGKATSSAKSKTFTLEDGYITYTSMFISDIWNFTRSLYTTSATTLYYSSESTSNTLKSNRFYRTIILGNYYISVSISHLFNTDIIKCDKISPGRLCQTNETADAAYTSKIYNSLFYEFHLYDTNTFDVTSYKTFRFEKNNLSRKNFNIFNTELYIYAWDRMYSSLSMTATASITRTVDGYAETNKSYTYSTVRRETTFLTTASFLIQTWQ